MIQHAFTRKYNKITNVLRESVIIENSDDNSSISINNAIWDTGASISSINSVLASKLNLKPIGYVNIQTANGECTVPQYIINVKFNENLEIERLIVTGNNLVNIDMLLGMDIINHGQFTISNSGFTMISFIVPSTDMTDYVDLVNAKNKRLLKGMGRNALCPCGSGKKIKDCCGPKYGV